MWQIAHCEAGIFSLAYSGGIQKLIQPTEQLNIKTMKRQDHIIQPGEKGIHSMLREVSHEDWVFQ